MGSSHQGIGQIERLLFPLAGEGGHSFHLATEHVLGQLILFSTIRQTRNRFPMLFQIEETLHGVF